MLSCPPPLVTPPHHHTSQQPTRLNRLWATTRSRSPYSRCKFLSTRRFHRDSLSHITRRILYYYLYIYIYIVVTKKGFAAAAWVAPSRRQFVLCNIVYYCRYTWRIQINGADKTAREGWVAAGQPLTGVVSGGSRNQWTHQ